MLEGVRDVIVSHEFGRASRDARATIVMELAQHFELG
jgi:hypothetical protein